MQSLESDHGTAQALDHVAPRFIIGQSVFFERTHGDIRAQVPDGRYLVREAFTMKLRLLHAHEMVHVPHRVGPPSWVDMSPIERAIAYPGRCCDCGLVIGLAVIRCDEHERVYQAVVAEATRAAE